MVSNTGAPITVPVGQATLGRIMDVLGEPVDEAARWKLKSACRSIARRHLFEEQATSASVLETGIKVIDLIMPIAKAERLACSAAQAWVKRSR